MHRIGSARCLRSLWAAGTRRAVSTHPSSSSPSSSSSALSNVELGFVGLAVGAVGYLGYHNCEKLLPFYDAPTPARKDSTKAAAPAPAPAPILSTPAATPAPSTSTASDAPPTPTGSASGDDVSKETAVSSTPEPASSSAPSSSSSSLSTSSDTTATDSAPAPTAVAVSAEPSDAPSTSSSSSSASSPPTEISPTPSTPASHATPATTTAAPTSSSSPLSTAESGAQPPSYQVPYVLVGGGTASHFAMKGILERDPNAKILIISEEGLRPYARPPLSKEVWFKGVGDTAADVNAIRFETWSGDQRSLFYNDPDFYLPVEQLSGQDKGGVALLAKRKVIELDPVMKRLVLDDGTAVFYEKCLLAPGGRPRNLPVFEKAAEPVKNNVILFRTAEDYLHLNQAVENAQRVAVVGGGFLGSELAVALAHKGKDKGMHVDQIFPEKGNIAKVLPDYLSDWATKKVEKQGVTVHRSCSVVAAEAGEAGKVLLKLDNGETLAADKVLVAVGIEPSVELARSGRLEVDESKGGIVVNSELQARSDIWVAGDSCNFYDISLGRRREEHHDHAAVSGRLAGNNMAGARKPYFHQSMFWSDLGPDVGFEAIGIVDSSLPTVSVWARATPADTPKAAMESNPRNIRSTAGADSAIPSATATAPNTTATTTTASATSANDGEQYGKGVVYYMRDQKVVGILLWNVFNSIPIARKIIRSEKAFDNVQELSRFFPLHPEQ